MKRSSFYEQLIHESTLANEILEEIETKNRDIKRIGNAGDLTEEYEPKSKRIRKGDEFRDDDD